MQSTQKDPVFTAVLLATGLILLAGLALALMSLISPLVYIFVAIMLPLCLGPVAEIRGII